MSKQNISSKDYNGLEELLVLEKLHTYNNHIVSMAMKYVNPFSRVIDFGAGIGTLSTIFKDSFSISPDCIEIDEVCQSYLKKRKFNYYENLHDINDKVDIIFSSNVLEHIENDVEILIEMMKHLSPSGKIILYLPAHMFLWTKMDTKVGHYRRYSIAELKSKCSLVGLNIEAINYSDTIGFFVQILFKLMRLSPNSGPSSLPLLRFYSKWIFPISKFLDRLGFKYVCGKNIFFVATPIKKISK